MGRNIANLPELYLQKAIQTILTGLSNKDNLTSKTKRFTGGVNANFKATDWWDITARFGYDQYTTNDYTYIAPGSAVIPLYQTGRLSKDLFDYTYMSTTVMSNFHKTFGDFDTHLMLGTTSGKY